MIAEISANITLIILIFFGGSILVGFAGRNKRGGFLRAFLLSFFLSPFIGLFITLGTGIKNPKGCIHCGNKLNEAEYCGICGKNEAGLLFKPET